jgi:hypothetical protein
MTLGKDTESPKASKEGEQRYRVVAAAKTTRMEIKKYVKFTSPLSFPFFSYEKKYKGAAGF